MPEYNDCAHGVNGGKQGGCGNCLEPPLGKGEAQLVQIMVDAIHNGKTREFAIAVELEGRRVFSIATGRGAQLIGHTGLNRTHTRRPSGPFSEDELTTMGAHLRWVLRKYLIKTWEHLATLSENDLRRFKNVGDTSVKRIQACLRIKRGV